MALDLANNHDVFLSDNNKKSLAKIQSQNNSIQIQQLDVKNKNIKNRLVKKKFIFIVLLLI